MNLLEAIAQNSAERMVNSILEGFAIAVFAWLLLRVIGGRNSRTRFAVWFAALLAIAVLPVFGFAGTPSGIAARPKFMVSTAWAMYLFLAWIVLAAIGLARVGYAWLRIRRLRQSCTPLASCNLAFRNSVEAVCKDTARRPAIAVSDAVRMPMAIGFLRPMIILPRWAAQELSPAELNSVLLHELAHLERRDHWTNLAQKIVGALFFFHPAVWWIERQISLEREMACDDAVLEQLSNPRAYAQCLISVAEKSFLQRGLTLVQAAVGRARQITRRVASILEGRHGRTTRTSKPALALIAGFCVVSISLAEHAPRLIGFTDGNTSTPAAVNDSSIDPLSAAKVVPAALHLDSGPAPANARAAIEQKHSRGRASQQYLPKIDQRRPVLVRTKAAVVKPQAPMEVLAGVQQALAPSRTFLVVVQSVEPDNTGMPIWNFCVWRVTVDSAGKAVRMGVVAKSI